MKNIEDIIKAPCHVHFIGIGGISMSGLAELLLDKGYTVSGSDRSESDITNKLASLGAKICYGHNKENITDDISYVVYTAAIKDDNPEIVAAKEKDITCMTRAKLLGLAMSGYKTAISVAGTHGKTTTTSMISEIMLAYKCDPTISVGGMLHSIGGNFRVGHSQYFVTEACEYTNSFLSLISNVNVILNVREDHLDFFKDINDIRHSFRVFADNLGEDGTLVIGVLTQPDLYEKTVSNMVEVKSRGAYLMGLTTYGQYNIEDTVNFTVYVPKTDPLFANSLAIVSLQLLAYYISVAKGLDVDKPRNLAKSVTVE